MGEANSQIKAYKVLISSYFGVQIAYILTLLMDFGSQSRSWEQWWGIRNILQFIGFFILLFLLIEHVSTYRSRVAGLVFLAITLLISFLLLPTIRSLIFNLMPRLFPNFEFHHLHGPFIILHTILSILFYGFFLGFWLTYNNHEKIYSRFKPITLGIVFLQLNFCLESVEGIYYILSEIDSSLTHGFFELNDLRHIIGLCVIIASLVFLIVGTFFYIVRLSETYHPMRQKSLKLNSLDEISSPQYRLTKLNLYIHLNTIIKYLSLVVGTLFSIFISLWFIFNPLGLAHAWIDVQKGTFTVLIGIGLIVLICFIMGFSYRFSPGKYSPPTTISGILWIFFSIGIVGFHFLAKEFAWATELQLIVSEIVIGVGSLIIGLSFILLWKNIKKYLNLQRQ